MAAGGIAWRAYLYAIAELLSRALSIVSFGLVV